MPGWAADAPLLDDVPEGFETGIHLTLTGGNVTTFQFSSTEPQNAETVTVVFTQDVSGSRTVGLATNIKGTLTINTTVSTIATFQYDVFTQDWFVTTVGHN